MTELDSAQPFVSSFLRCWMTRFFFHSLPTERKIHNVNAKDAKENPEQRLDESKSEFRQVLIRKPQRLFPRCISYCHCHSRFQHSFE
jgi:hypothetical protein